jgi:hypothetical protein
MKVRHSQLSIPSAHQCNCTAYGRFSESRYLAPAPLEFAIPIGEILGRRKPALNIGRFSIERQAARND